MNLCTISYFKSKPYLSNPDGIFKTETMEAVLWLVKCVYFFDSPGIMLYGKNGLVSIFLPTNMAAGIQVYRDFISLEQLKLCIC